MVVVVERFGSVKNLVVVFSLILINEDFFVLVVFLKSLGVGMWYVGGCVEGDD